jgi:hypothetical protein
LSIFHSDSEQPSTEPAPSQPNDAVQPGEKAPHTAAPSQPKLLQDDVAKKIRPFPAPHTKVRPTIPRRVNRVMM